MNLNILISEIWQDNSDGKYIILEKLYIYRKQILLGIQIISKNDAKYKVSFFNEYKDLNKIFYKYYNENYLLGTSMEVKNEINKFLIKTNKLLVFI